MMLYKATGKIPVGAAPIGLFFLDAGEIICITEYYTNGNRDAYIVSSGEKYCGGDEERGVPILITKGGQ